MTYRQKSGRLLVGLMWNALRILLLLACLGCLGCRPDPAWQDVNDVSWQRNDEIDETAWRPVREGEALPRDDARPVWLRLRTPPAPGPDPALGIGHGRALRQAIVDGRTIELHRSLHIIPVQGAGSTVLLEVPTVGVYTRPSFTLGPQRTFWLAIGFREVPHAVVGGLVLITGLLMLAASAVRRRSNAYLGLGLFLGSLGTLTILNLRNLALLIPVAGTRYDLIHHAVTLLYPIGFVLFARATFGDSKWAVLGRGLRVYLAFALVATSLHVLDLVSLDITRNAVALFISVFAVQAIILAMRLARQRDPRGRPFLVGIAILLAFGLQDATRSVEYQMLPFGLLGFGVSMVLVLEAQFTRAHQLAQASAAELSLKLEALQQSNREVQALNTELRHQIAERSRQMVYVLQAEGGAIRESRLLHVGEVLGDRYRILSVLGQGGMGAVYEVERTTDHKRLALKVMAGDVAPMAAARFAREAEIAARVIDEHLVPVLDISGPDSPTLYLVMDLVVGRSLEDARDRFGDVAWGLGILSQIARGLAALHDAGVVHRDLKPANVLLSPRPDGTEHVRIADFGISHLQSAPLAEGTNPGGEAALGSTVAASTRLPDAGSEETLAAPSGPASTSRARASSSALTATGMIMGTPGYMAPEMVGGARAARPAADMFAFGLIAFELLSGQRAFELPPSQMLLSNRSRTPSRSLPDAVPARVSAMILACIDFQPNGRPGARQALEVLQPGDSTSVASGS